MGWQLTHTEGINESRQHWEDLGYAVFTENQNSFALRGRTATLGGQRDVLARPGWHPRTSTSPEALNRAMRVPGRIRRRAWPPYVCRLPGMVTSLTSPG